MTRQDASTDALDKPPPRVHSPDRSQVDPNPKRIDELIPPDHKARLVWAMVEELDMTRLLDNIKSVEGHPGRDAIDPRILVALWLYATDEGISKAREVARRCGDCDPYKWICGGVHVNYHTLSDFRVQQSEWLREQVVTNIAAMRAEGLASLDKLGQDGMRVRASAGSDSFKKAEKLSHLLEKAEQQWDELQQEFEQTQRTPAEQAAQTRAARERIERLKQAQQQVQQVAEQREKRKKGDGATARASTTDPEARRMKMADGGTRPAYNVQLDTDLDSLVIMGADVVQSGSDSGQIEPMVQQIETDQGPLPEEAEYYVDGGFASNADLESMDERGVTVFAPVKAVEKKQQNGEDPFAPKRGDTPPVAQWRQRMGTDEAQQKYKQRSKTEYPNATCRNRGLHQFLVRGLDKVRTVVMWYVLTHNLFRMVALRAERSPAVA
jgi:transposase